MLGVLGDGKLGIFEGELLLEGMLGTLIGDGRLGGGVIGAHAVSINPMINDTRGGEILRLLDL